MADCLLTWVGKSPIIRCPSANEKPVAARPVLSDDAVDEAFPLRRRLMTCREGEAQFETRIVGENRVRDGVDERNSIKSRSGMGRLGRKPGCGVWKCIPGDPQVASTRPVGGELLN